MDPTRQHMRWAKIGSAIKWLNDAEWQCALSDRMRRVAPRYWYSWKSFPNLINRFGVAELDQKQPEAPGHESLDNAERQQGKERHPLCWQIEEGLLPLLIADSIFALGSMVSPKCRGAPIHWSLRVFFVGCSML